MRIVFIADAQDSGSGEPLAIADCLIFCVSCSGDRCLSSIHSDVSLWAGLVAFELPLAYIYSDKFNQPIFGANNLSGNLLYGPSMCSDER